MDGKWPKGLKAFPAFASCVRMAEFEKEEVTLTPGFTFIEVLMAVSILAILLVGVHKLQSQMVSMSQTTQFFTLAPLLAQSQMAEMERRHFKDIQKDSGDFGGAYPGYVWSLSMETLESEVLKKLAHPMKKIEVSVSFNKDERTYRLRTYRVVSDKAAAETQNKRLGPT
ncbi:MAG: prepilin-type N-terminal cleavage/methylation domain-containing protein [Pseudomonadota bacterium]